MSVKLLSIFLIILISLSLAAAGCKGRREEVSEAPTAEEPGAAQFEEVSGAPITEPALDLGAMETIPPTAAPEVKAKPAGALLEKSERTRDIQRALKNAGFYKGAIDGKLGPKTKLAIEEFQKANGLKVDGKVGPRTWAALEKHLTQ